MRNYSENSMDRLSQPDRGRNGLRWRFIFYLLVIITTVLPAASLGANSLSQFGITWTFDKELSTDGSGDTYQYGQFANGDYWVKGPATVIAIDPPSTEVDGRVRNGSVINPSPANGNTHGYDSHAPWGTYSSELNVGFNTSAINPLIIQPDSSLVSSISNATAGNRPQLKTAAILTVLNSAPAGGSFRPAYTNVSKEIKFNTSQLNYSLLGTLDAQSAGITTVPQLTQVPSDAQSGSVERMFERPWLDHMPGSAADWTCHPSDNMPNYGRELSGQIGIGALMLHLNFTNQEKETLLIRYVQLGIDLYGIVQDGGRTNWYPDGGIASGRKWPILFAGLVLNDSDMKAIGSKSGDYLDDGGNYAGNVPADYIYFGEDAQTFTIDADDVYSQPYTIVCSYQSYGGGSDTVNVTNGSVIVQGVNTSWIDSANIKYFAVVGDNQAYDIKGHCYKIVDVDEANQQLTLDVAYEGQTSSGVDYRTARYLWYGHGYPTNIGIAELDFWEYDSDVLNWPEWGIRHAPYPQYSGRNWNSAYRRDCTANSWAGFVLAAHIMNGPASAKTLWNHDALFNYQDRYMQAEQLIQETGVYNGEACSQISWYRQTSEFAEDMWDTYRADYGSVWTESSDNSAPALTSIGDKSVSENSSLDFSVSATDADGDTITYSAIGLPAGAAFAGQSFSWTPGDNQAGAYNVTFTASDGTDQDSETITITVNNINGPPVLSDIGDKSVYMNDTLTFTVNATDPDNDTIEFTMDGLPSNYKATFANQTFDWTPKQNHAGSHQVTFTASDGTGQDTETITITVDNSNRVPVLATVGDKTVSENSSLSFTLSAADADGDRITYSVTGLPTGANLKSNTGAFVWIPDYTQAGTYNITFTASDGQAQDSEAITIVVNNTNQPPVLVSIGNKSVSDNSSLSFSVSATDPDSDTITYSATGLPTGATFTNQNFSWTPGQDQTGSYDVTFTASDSQATDSETITIIAGQDTSAPRVNNRSPRKDSIQTSLNSLIVLDIVDDGEGVDASTVNIKVDNNLVYAGDTSSYSSPHGKCRRVGNSNAYKYIYQPNEKFDFDQQTTVTVNASDLAATTNVMDEYSYSFISEMRSFGEKKTLVAGKEIISSGANKDSERPLTTVSDSSGNVWVAWTEGDEGPNNSLINRDIWIGKITPGTDGFESDGVFQVTDDAPDQANPVLAIDSSDNLYLVWQDQRLGNWDLYLLTSTDNWSNETRITDPNYNQTNPAMAIDSSDKVYIVYDDDRNTDKDIYIASSTDNYVSKTQITSAATGALYDQTTPDIAIDSADTVYLVWADQRNSSLSGGKNPRLNIKYDIYGAASNSWTNIEIVDIAKAGHQTAPKVATEDSGTILHFVWVDDEPGDREVYYGSSDGLPAAPLTGTNIIDRNLPADIEQKQPAIAVTGRTGGAGDDALGVFACWEDERYSGIENIHAVEITNLGTNIWVGDDGAGKDQKVPAIGIDPDNQPYLVWVNNKSDIIYAGSTFIDPDPLVPSKTAPVSSNTTIGTSFGTINDTDDVSVAVPAGAYVSDIDVTISRIRNPQKPPSNNRTSLYEFGPSGTTFSEPVTITIPYNAAALVKSPSAYWYDPLTGVYSQEGITDAEIIQISSGLYALRFKTTHFSIFGGGGAFGVGGGGGGGGGGGCSMSPDGQGTIAEFLLPYIGFAVVIIILKLRDKRKKKMRNIAKSE